MVVQFLFALGWLAGMVREFGLWPPPEGYRHVFVDEEVRFHEREVTRKDRSSHGPKTASNSFVKNIFWTVKKLNGVEFCSCCGECATDSAVYKHETVDGEPVGEPSYCPLKVDPSRDGQKRFRVWVDGEWLYLHQVLAFAFHRDWVCPHILDFQTFRKKFQGDHLAWVKTGELEVPTQPELCLAGWIQAVSKKEHDRRTGLLKCARAVLRQVSDFETKERETAAQLKDVSEQLDALKRKNTARARKLKENRRSLRCVEKEIEKKRAAGIKLLETEWPQADKYKDTIKKMKGLYFSFDGAQGDDGVFKAVGGNGLLAECFLETSDARRAMGLFFHKRINAQKKVR